MNRRDGTLILSVCLAATTLVGCAQMNTAGSYNDKAKTIVVRANMKTVQNAAEKYAKDHIYLYPTKIDDEFKYYFPDGDVAAKKVGTAPTNPFSGTAEWPILGTLTDENAARSAPPTAMAAGTVEYSALNNGKSYAIRGGAEDGKAVPGNNASGSGTLVLSRDNYEKPATP